MMHFFSTTKRPLPSGGGGGDKNDCDVTVTKEDVEKGRNGWQHAAKMTRQAFLRVGTLAESTNAANEIRDARLDAMEKRIGDLETRCHVLLNGLESEREDKTEKT